jgi:hypothetical protein
VVQVVEHQQTELLLVEEREPLTKVSMELLVVATYRKVSLAAAEVLVQSVKLAVTTPEETAETVSLLQLQELP